MGNRVPGRPRGLYRVILFGVKVLARTFFKLSPSDVPGREHIPETGGFILCSNHASYLDPPLLALASPRQMTYIAKVELFANPAFAWLIHALGARPIRRGTGDRESFELALRLLAEGHGLVIYPEGTRTLTGEMGRLRIGAAMMALKARVPIIPAWIDGSFEVWPKGGKIRPAAIKVRIGPPLKMDDVEDSPKGARALTARLKIALEELKSTG